MEIHFGMFKYILLLVHQFTIASISYLGYFVSPIDLINPTNLQSSAKEYN